MMQQAFLDINSVRTNVLTFGRWVEESSKTKDPEDIILVIPGNPGVTGFYKQFMLTLHEKTGYPVWIVSHAGHELPKNNSVFPVQQLKGHEDLFGLEGQIEHKKEFIERYVPNNARLHLIGHSIGTYIILNLLKEQSINSRVVDVKLLFPTIEYMAETPNGKFLTTFIKPIVWLIVFLCWIYTVLPTFLQGFLMTIYMKIQRLPKIHYKTLIHFIEPTIIEKVFFMAFEELEQVIERDNRVIKANLEKIKLLYGDTDGWAPPIYCDNLKNDIPEVNAEMSEFHHSFVLQQSREVGCVVADWLTP